MHDTDTFDCQYTLDQRCFDTGRRRCLRCRRLVAACPGCRDCIAADLAAGALDLGEAGA